MHKKTVVACLLRSAEDGTTVSQKRTFSTMSVGLERLRDWLREQGVTHVALEATGVYWKPVLNVLEPRCTVLVANPEHIKAIPRRKTDPKDAAWITRHWEESRLRNVATAFLLQTLFFCLILPARARRKAPRELLELNTSLC